MSKNPNPQGKGTPGVLAILDGHRSGLGSVPAKPADQVATELFTSLFVLEARFRFKPVPGTPYYLYRPGDHFQLCLSPPSMLSESVGGRFIGVCELRRDMTWSVALDPPVAADPAFTAYLAEQREAFERRLSEADAMDEVLPNYERRLPFHRRAAAFAVAYSLGRSMALAGTRGLSYDEARGLLNPPD
ncbi:MAG: DUF2452 domain-containing protein [Salinisphaera sp.]|nr:DUF2452 domain-containing protein [Salinisphaera sp.]